MMDTNIQDALLKFEVKKDGSKTKHFHAVVKVKSQNNIKFEMKVEQGMVIEYQDDGYVKPISVQL